MSAESGKAPGLCKSKIFLKKVSCPVTSYLRARSAQGYNSVPHWIVFPECCHNFWLLKKQLICLQVSQTHPKSGISIGIYSSIKAADGSKKSSPSYQFNRLHFDFKKLSVRSPWDHLKNFSCNLQIWKKAMQRYTYYSWWWRGITGKRAPTWLHTFDSRYWESSSH